MYLRSSKCTLLCSGRLTRLNFGAHTIRISSSYEHRERNRNSKIKRVIPQNSSANLIAYEMY